VRTMRKRLKRSLKKVTEWCRKHRHDPVTEQQAALNRMLQGHYQYYGRRTNFRSLWQFFRSARRIWKQWLKRRNRKRSLSWSAFEHLLARHPLLHPGAAKTMPAAQAPSRYRSSSPTPSGSILCVRVDVVVDVEGIVLVAI
jgi:hypothetical protein